jgi:hypothetical protein
MDNVFSRIVVGVDDSEPATAAVAYAARLARDHGGELVLASVINWVSLIAQAGSDGAAIIDAGSIMACAGVERALSASLTGSPDSGNIVLDYWRSSVRARRWRNHEPSRRNHARARILLTNRGEASWLRGSKLRSRRFQWVRKSPGTIAAP